MIMAKKKADVEIEAAEEVEKIAGFDLRSFNKDWRAKIKKGQDFKDDELKHISTGSIKLDWALRRPFLEGQMVEIFAENAVGKAQPLSSTVMTPNGPVKMGDIKVGDYVMTPHCGKARVLGVYPQGIKKIYKIEFSDGASTRCCAEHLWLTQSFKERHRGNGKWEVLSLEEIKDSLYVGEKSHKNFKIPLTNPVEFEAKDTPLDAYFVGLLIGDGYLSSKYNSRISSMDKQLVLAASSNGFGLNKVSGNNCDYRFVGQLNGKYIKEYLKELGLADKRSYEKYIPDIYKLNSSDVRLSILQGLMDTDGYISSNGHCSYSTTSEQLAKDVIWVVQSLGGVAWIKEKVKEYTYNGIKKTGRKVYDVTIIMPRNIIPFRLERKVARWNPQIKSLSRFITNITYVGEEEAQCIYIDSDEHLYLTDDFIVTHNTTLALEVARNAMDMGKLVFYIDLEYKLREAQLNMIEGFNRDKFVILFPDNGEEAMNMMHDLMINYPGCVIILDSVGGLLPEVEDADDFEAQKMGVVAKLCHKMVRKLTGINSRNKCVTIFLNHLTSTMATYGKSETTHGGKAIRNRAAQRIELKALAADVIKTDGGDKIGQVVTATVVKNNVNRPYITVKYPVIFGKGIHRELDILEFAKDLGLVVKSGSWLSCPIPEQEEPKALRESEIIDRLRADKQFKDFLTGKINSLFE